MPFAERYSTPGAEMRMGPARRQRRGLSARQETLANIAAARRAADRLTEPAVGRQYCERCGSDARIDIHDPFRGRMHLSCHTCYRMWQVTIEPTIARDDSLRMRD